MRILFATDFSRDAETAQKLLMGMPLPTGSRIRIVSALEPITAVSVFAPAPVLDVSEDATEESRAELKKIERTLRRSGVEIDYALRLGRAADVIVEECVPFEPDLIVMGTRGRGAFATNILGSVSAEVIDRAPAPVLVARGSTLMSAVLAEDGSPSAAAGADFIARYAPFADVPVHVVSVVDVAYPVVLADPTGTGAAVQAYSEYRLSIERTRKVRDAQLTTRLLALRQLGLRASGEVREGDAAFELVEAAKARNADCIVIGSRGQTGLRRVMLGSVARSVLYHANCSVLIVHQPAGAQQPHRELVAASSGKEV